MGGSFPTLPPTPHGSRVVYSKQWQPGVAAADQSTTDRTFSCALRLRKPTSTGIGHRSQVHEKMEATLPFKPIEGFAIEPAAAP
jgi:hypothetical protein